MKPEVPSNLNAHLAVDAACTLGEGPVWHAGALWWVDIVGMRLHRWREGCDSFDTFPMPERIGFAVPASGTEWAVGLQSGVHLWNSENNKLELLHAPEADQPGTRFNDGKCDPQGRLWAGTMGLKAENGVAALYRMEGRGSCTKMLANITISNGLAWDSGKRRMYYIDTKTREVAGFGFDAATGDISNRRVVTSIPTETGAPDGMTIDHEGMLWVALWGGFGVIRVDPADGTVLSKVEVPAPNVTSCTFGSEVLDTLYITTARVGMNAELLQKHPAAGAVFAVQPGVRGLPVTPFAL